MSESIRLLWRLVRLLPLLRRLKMLCGDIDSGDAHSGAIQPGVKKTEITPSLERLLAERSSGAGLSFLIDVEGGRGSDVSSSAMTLSVADTNDIVRPMLRACLARFLGDIGREGVPILCCGIDFFGEVGIEPLRSKSVSISISIPSELIVDSQEARSRKRGTY